LKKLEKKLEKRKNVIYTSSKVLRNSFENEKEIENKFGKFSYKILLFFLLKKQKINKNHQKTIKINKNHQKK
jgi:hypothetical protein